MSIDKSNINKVKVGKYAGFTSQGSNAIAIGLNAGYTNQGVNSIAIGANSSAINSLNSIVIGPGASSKLDISNQLVIGFDASNSSFGGIYGINLGKDNFKLGINTNNPKYDLDVSGEMRLKYIRDKNDSTGSSGQVLSSTSNGIQWITGGGGGTSYWDISGTNDIYNNNAGNVGIGTNSPAYILDVSGETRIQTINIRIGRSAGFTNQGSYSIGIGYQAGYSGQQNSAISIGYKAGNSGQKENAISIGSFAGEGVNGNKQQENAIAIGYEAGNNNQSYSSIAIGYQSGRYNKYNDSISIGTLAGEDTQKEYSIAIGYFAGQLSQSSNSIAIGYRAGQVGQSSYSIAIGPEAGYSNMSTSSIAIGHRAGYELQSENSIAIGKYACYSSKQYESISLGYYAGNSGQGANSIAIGSFAGNSAQGANSIAIGSYAGYYDGFNQNSQPANSIIIDAMGNSGSYIGQYNPTTSNACYIRPIRDNNDTTYALMYNTTNYEVFYNSTSGKTFIIDHPVDNDKYLVHACLEGPEVGVYYRGHSHFNSNETQTTITLPEYVKVFAYDFTINITAINDDGPSIFNLSSSRVNNGQFTVYRLPLLGKDTLTQISYFDWTVFAKRNDINAEPYKKDVVVKGDGPYKYI
jgi:hypothetical protein